MIEYIPLLFAYLLLTPGPLPAAPPGAPGAPRSECINTFTWFGKLGFPDVKGNAFVRVATGSQVSGAHVPTPMYVKGFLLGEQGNRFSVLLATMEKVDFERTTDKDVPPWGRVGFRRIDFAGEAAAYLSALRKGKWSDVEEFGHNHTSPYSRRVEAFGMAWACWRNDLERLAFDLFECARAIPTAVHAEGAPACTSLKHALADDLAYFETWQGVEMFGSTGPATRKDIAEQFRRVLTRFPHSRYAGRARIFLNLLEEMIREDGAHQRRVESRHGVSLTKQERIADLIFELRDQEGVQSDVRDYRLHLLGPFMNRFHRETTAEKLEKLDYDALPQLIGTLDDRRFTGIVTTDLDCEERQRRMPQVFRIRDCAEQIIEDIAGQRFFEPSSARAALLTDDQVPWIKAKIGAWFAAQRRKSQKQILVEETEKGEWSSVNRAEQLLASYPQAFLPALAIGVRRAKDRDARERLADVATKSKEDVTQFFREEMSQSPFLWCRVRAAKVLLQRGRTDGVPPMITEWKRAIELGKKGKPWSREYEDDLWSLADFLSGAGRVDALKALAPEFSNVPKEVRRSVIRSLDTGLYSLRAIESISGSPFTQLRNAVVSVLVPELDDNDDDASQDRVSDEAATALHHVDPNKFPFDWSDIIFERDMAIIEIKNTLRREQGKPPLPFPVYRRPARIPEEKVQPLVRSLLICQDSERRSWERRIESLGVGALPAMRRCFDAIPKDMGAGKQVIEPLLKRLACTVTEIEFDQGSLAPPADLAARLSSLKGKPFAPKAFIGVIAPVVRHLPNGVRAMRVSVERPEAATGIRLRLDLLDEERALKLDPQIDRGELRRGNGTTWYWDSGQRVQIGNDRLLSHGESTPWPVWAWADTSPLSKALDKVAVAPIDKPIDVRITAVAEFRE